MSHFFFFSFGKQGGRKKENIPPSTQTRGKNPPHRFSTCRFDKVNLTIHFYQTGKVKHWSKSSQCLLNLDLFMSNFTVKSASTSGKQMFITDMNSAYLWTSIVSRSLTVTQAHRRMTWLQKIMIPIKNPAPNISVSRGCAYSACIPNGDCNTHTAH